MARHSVEPEQPEISWYLIDAYQDMPPVATETGLESQD